MASHPISLAIRAPSSGSAVAITEVEPRSLG